MLHIFTLVLSGKNLPAMQETQKTASLIPGWGRSPGEGNGNPLLYSCLENFMDKGVWWTTVHGVTNSRTQLKQLITHTHVHAHISPEKQW